MGGHGGGVLTTLARWVSIQHIGWHRRRDFSKRLLRPDCYLLVLTVACHRQPSIGQPDSSALSGEESPSGATAPANSVSPAAYVGLDGQTTVPPEADTAANQRIYARAFQTWVYAEPRPNSARLGYLRMGSSAAIRSSPTINATCPRGWYSLVPRGFVCLDDSSTIDGNDPIVSAMRDLGPAIARKLPFTYGTVRRPGPIYRRVPTSEDLAAAEPDLAKRYDRWLSASGETGANYGQQVWVPAGATVPDPGEVWRTKQSDPFPEFLRSGKFAPRIPGESAPTNGSVVLGMMAPRVGYSLMRTFLAEGRRYGVTTKFEIVSTDRLRPILGSDFHGFRIPEDIDFPFAIVRQPGAMLFSFDAESKKASPKERATYRSAVKLTGKQALFRGKLHYETSAGLWLSDRDASRLDPVRKMPAWGSNGEKWIDINVTKQTLALYEGTKAVYATLVSTGEAGLSDPTKSTATKRGIYRIHTKHISVTMDSDEVGEEFELRDVPYVQYFESSYALHGAYWHDRFGIPKSHGCINLAPEDARRIFFWTEPTLPAGWHGVLLPLKGTVLFVHP